MWTHNTLCVRNKSWCNQRYWWWSTFGFHYAVVHVFALICGVLIREHLQDQDLICLYNSRSSEFYVLGPFHTMLAIQIFHNPLNRSSSFLFTLLFYSPLAFLRTAGIGGGAHREWRPPAGQQHSVCRLRSVRQRHTGGPQHRRRPQLLHAGPSEFSPLTSVQHLWF